MAAKCFRASAFAFVTWIAGAEKHQEAQNRTSHFQAGAASMIVSGITNTDEYCLCVANGALCMILFLGRLCLGLPDHCALFGFSVLRRACAHRVR